MKGQGCSVGAPVPWGDSGQSVDSFSGFQRGTVEKGPGVRVAERSDP